MAILVSTIGLSPAVVTETIDELEKRGAAINRVRILLTRGSRPSYDVLNLDFAFGPYQGTKDLEPVDIALQDIKTEGDCKTFRANVRRELRTALNKAGSPEQVYVSLAGGRKTMPIDAMLVAMSLGIMNVYHVIAEEILGVASVMDLFSKVEMEEIQRYSKEGKRPPEALLRKILDLCHPKGLTVHLIRIPIPRLTLQQRRELAKQLF